MTTEEFATFVERVCLALEELSQENPERVAARNTGEKFEACVAEAVQEVINANYHGATIHYTPGSHAFPDIVVEFVGGERYGIEVKSSSSATSRSWKINGNSVLGSTKENVLDTYIIFGKTARGNQAFRYKRYEEAVANVGVTHSPRYLIDLDVTPEETFFAKSGLSYQEISQSDNPIGLITDYFRSQGQKAWWLAESDSATLRLFGDLPAREQDSLIGYCFAHFPEIFSSGSKKFSRCAIWMIMDRGVVSTSLRDNFSAGGRVDIHVSGETYCDVFRVFKSLQKHRVAVRRELSLATSDKLRDDWGIAVQIPPIFERRAEIWSTVVAGNLKVPGTEGMDAKQIVLNILMEE